MSQKTHKLTVRNSADQNRKVLEKAMRGTDNLKALHASIKESTGADIFDKVKFPFHDPNFSIKRMRESVASTQFPQLLRAGVQMALNSLIEQYTDTTYEQWAHVINSTMDTELYAPLHGLSFLSERGPTQKFSEAQVAGLDLKLKNREFGEILAIDQNTLDDDQTGQLQQLVGDLAEWSKLLMEVYCYGKLNSVAGQSYAGLSIPVSETQPSYESNYPYAAASAGFKGGGYNRPASYAALGQDGIKTGVEALMVQKNLLGLIMNVKPKGLIVSPFYQFDAMVLMQSTLNPSVPSATPGTTGQNYSVNPIKSILDPIVSRYVFDNNGAANGLSKAWYLVDTSKPWFVQQIRQAPSVIMENPDSGESFNRKVERHRLDVRMNSDFIDPRFVWRGSDGSA